MPHDRDSEKQRSHYSLNPNEALGLEVTRVTTRVTQPPNQASFDGWFVSMSLSRVSPESVPVGQFLLLVDITSRQRERELFVWRLRPYS